MTRNDFVDAFLQNKTCKKCFSIDGIFTLWDYFMDLEEETGEEIDFDIVYICSNYVEYNTSLEAIADYTEEIKTEFDALEWLQNKTEVIEIPEGGIIIYKF